jgi:hypothetical protein
MKRHTVWSAITLANRGPSVHNTQPWRWRVIGESIHLAADHTRRLRATDLDGRDLLLSCGAALHHLRVALAALGWRAEVRHAPDPNRLATVAVSPNQPSIEDIALADAITLRRTDRRRVSSRPVPGEHLDLMVERATSMGALLVPVTEGHARRLLTRAMDLAACLQPDDLAYDTELTTWSGRGPGTPDGVLAASTPPFPPTHGNTTMRAFVPGTSPTTTTTNRTAANSSCSRPPPTIPCPCYARAKRPAPPCSPPPASAWPPAHSPNHSRSPAPAP